jgi:hypothetical protein
MTTPTGLLISSSICFLQTRWDRRTSKVIDVYQEQLWLIIERSVQSKTNPRLKRFFLVLMIIDWPGLYTRIPWTERQNSRCVHGFRGPNARTLVAFTDSVDRTPELSLHSRIPWTERQKYRCVPWTECQELSLRPRISWTLLHTNHVNC